MKTGTFVVQYGKEPFLTNRMRKEAEGALHHSLSQQTFAYVVILSRYSDERTLNELKNHRHFVENKVQMNKWIKFYKKKYNAKIEKLGFD